VVLDLRLDAEQLLLAERHYTVTLSHTLHMRE
jgi:hypothetical protein